MRMHRNPFTLVEILVVIGVIGVLSGIAIGTARYVSRHNQEVATKTLMKQIEIGLEAVYNRFGYYPPQSTMGDFVLPYKPKDDDPDKTTKENTWPAFSNIPKAYVKLFCRSVEMERLYKGNTGGEVQLLDAWGKPIQYRCPGTVNKSSFDLVSGGPDGETDSPYQADNIANYELEN